MGDGFLQVVAQQEDEMVEVYEEAEACLVSSRYVPVGWWDQADAHMPAIDLDFPCELRESSPGRYHLFMDRAMTWEQYADLLRSFHRAGLIESGFLDSSLARGASYLRAAPRGERETVDWDRPVNPPSPFMPPVNPVDPFVTEGPATIEWRVEDDGVLREIVTDPEPVFGYSLTTNPSPVVPPTSQQLVEIEQDLDDIWAVLARLENNERTTCGCAGCNTESVGPSDATARWSAAPERRPSWQPEARPVASSGSADAGERDRILHAISVGDFDALVVRRDVGVGGDSSDAGSEAGRLAAERVDGNS